MECYISLLSETDRYLSSDRSGLYAANFERIFEEHLKPFELRHEDAKSAATQLWHDYSAKSNRLDFLPLESVEYRLLDKECDAVKAEYDKAHALVNLLYQEWQQECERCFCMYCFKPLFLDMLVERLKGIAGSIIADLTPRHRPSERKPACLFMVLVVSRTIRPHERGKLWAEEFLKRCGIFPISPITPL